MQDRAVSPFPGCVHRIGIVSPSKAVDSKVFRKSVETIRSFGVECVCAPHCTLTAEESYFAADDAARAADLNALIHDESIDLILCARGGYGAGYLPQLIDWDTLRKRNLPVCGYSDVTALHMAMLAKGAGIPVSTQMASGISGVLACPFTAGSMNRTLARAMGQSVPAETYTLHPVQVPDGMKTVSGPIAAGNVATMVSLCGTPWMPDLTGYVLAVEEIDEEPRKIDRMLLQLDLCGYFDRVGAVIAGYFSGDCGTAEEKARILRRFAARHPRTPFFDGLPFGHVLPSLSFVDGTPVELNSAGVLTI